MYRIYIIFAVYFIILFAVIHFLSKRARKRQAQKEGIPEGETNVILGNNRIICSIAANKLLKMLIYKMVK